MSKAHRAKVLICDIEGGEVDLLMQSDLARIKKIIIETHYGGLLSVIRARYAREPLQKPAAMIVYNIWRVVVHTGGGVKQLTLALR